LKAWLAGTDSKIPKIPDKVFMSHPETDYLELSGMLSNEIRRDFTFIHPEYFLGEKYEIEEGIGAFEKYGK
jgi:hypothetical protein